MPWVKFTDRFDFHVKRNVTISYKANASYLVKQACADEAIAKGRAVLTDRPKAPEHAGR